jgi:hypothetical protein
MGTAHYMSPEQAAGEPVDGRSDLYALGVVAFRTLSGRVPFEGTPAAVLVAHLSKPAPSLRDLGVPVSPALAAVVARCLEKRPDDRFASAAEFADALEAAVAAPADVSRARPAPKLAHDERDAVISERVAEDLWRRASEIQADTSGVQPVARPDLPVLPAASSDGYTMGNVRQAAADAGIDPRFVALAVAEQQHARDRVPSDRTARVLFGSDTRRLHVTRIIGAAPERVLPALGEVLQAPPYELTLADVAGDPLDGGVLTFNLPGAPSPITSRVLWAHLRFGAGARRLLVTLRSVRMPDGSGDGTEVSLHADLTPGRRSNVAGALFLDGVGAGGGAVAGWALAAKLAIAGVAGAGLTGGLGLAGLAAGIIGYHTSFRSTLRRAAGEMAAALDAVGLSLRAATVFGAAPGKPALQRRAVPLDPRTDDG